jgi:hypothetical protein
MPFQGARNHPSARADLPSVRSFVKKGTGCNPRQRWAIAPVRLAIFPFPCFCPFFFARFVVKKFFKHKVHKARSLRT